MGQVFASFPGVAVPTSCNASDRLGPFPAQATLKFHPQVTPPLVTGTLVFGESSTGVITWYNSKVDKASLRLTGDGHITACTILDRRVWWLDQVISGTYNEADPNGVDKTFVELVQILLDAMDEAGYDISILDSIEGLDDIYPFVHWECDNPSQQLHRLLQQIGCDIALNKTSNRVQIVRYGTGNALPSGFIRSVDFGVTVGRIPEYVRVCGNETWFEAKIKLKPVLFDTVANDSELKDLNDVSFAPVVDGQPDWSQTVPLIFPMLPEEDQEVNAICGRFLYRIYQIESINGGLDVPGGPTLDSIHDIVLRSVKLNGSKASLEGDFYPMDVDAGVIENVEDQVYPHAFKINPDLGTVELYGPAFKYDAEDGYSPADLYIHTSFKVRNPENRQVIRYELDRLISESGYGVRPIVRPDLQLQVKAQYDVDDPQELDDSEPYVNNLDELNATANSMIDAILPEFGSYESNVVFYMTTLQIECDGVIRQVRHEVDCDKGATTMAAQNTEPEVGNLRNAEMVRLALEKGRQQREDESARQRLTRTIQLEQFSKEFLQ